MTQRLERVYVASCPFCDYRELFSSQLTMLSTYGAHLLRHEEEALAKGRCRGREATQEMEGVARHFQRLNTARYN